MNVLYICTYIYICMYVCIYIYIYIYICIHDLFRLMNFQLENLCLIVRFFFLQPFSTNFLKCKSHFVLPYCIR